MATGHRSLDSMSSAVVQGIGVTELLIVLGIVLVIFGPKRLPMLGRQLGAGMREFKDGITRRSREEEESEAERPALEPPPAPAVGEPVAGDPAAERDR